MDLREHFLVIWRRKWIVLVLAAMVGGGVYGLTRLQHAVYQASSQIQVIPGATPNNGSQSEDTLFLSDTYAQLATTRPVLVQAARSSRLRIDEKTAERRLKVKASTDVGFLTVTAQGPSPGAAKALAQGEVTALTTMVIIQQQAALQQQLASVQSAITNLTSRLQSVASTSATATALNTELQALYQAVANREAQSDNQLTVVAPPHADSAPVAPKPRRDAVLAFVTALVVISELAVLREFLSDRFRAEAVEEEIRRLTGLPVLAEVPEGAPEKVIEAFRTLRASLLFLESDTPVRSAAMVSSEPAAGKSFSCINLAASVAELGVRVVLVDGDLRRPVIHERMGVARSPGLSDVLMGKDLWSSLQRDTGVDHLMVLPAGAPAADPPGLMADLGKRVINPLRADPVIGNELVVFDTPAEGLFPDAATIAAQCDATILIIDLRHSRRRAVRQAVERLRRVQARPVGVVINRAGPAVTSARYRYRYRYPDAEEAQKRVSRSRGRSARLG